jgi:YesN/AraC family two-component response regulator
MLTSDGQIANCCRQTTEPPGASVSLPTLDSHKEKQVLKLVIADDNPHALHGLRAILTSHPGVEVAGEAARGDEAIALVERLQPDVALLDVRMPVADGVEATRIIKQRWPKVRVVLISMYTEYRAEALSTGADAFLVKGCPADELLSTVTGTKGK